MSGPNPPVVINVVTNDHSTVELRAIREELQRMGQQANETGDRTVAALRDIDRHADGAAQGVDRATRGMSSGFSGAIDKAKGLALVLAGGFVGTQLANYGKDAVALASDTQEVATKLQAVFGEGTAAVEEFAAKGPAALGQTSLAVKDAASTFGVFGKAAGLAGAENAKFSTDLAALSTDLASFYNSDPSEVIEALGAGLRGEAEPLRKYGILMDDATLKQKAMSLGIISNTKDALLPNQKILAAQALIMEQTSIAQGDFAKTSGGLANQQRILNATWDEGKAKIGQAFLPAVVAVTTGLNQRLGPAIDGIAAKIPELTAKIGGVWSVMRSGEGFDAIGGPDSLAGRIALWGYAAIEQIDQLSVDIPRALAPLWRLLTTGDKNLDVGTQAISTPLSDFILMIRDVGLSTFDKLRGIWDTLWATGEDLWPSLVSIGESLGKAFSTLSGEGLSVWGLLLDGFQKVADLMREYLVPAFEWLARFMRENPDSVLAFVGVIGAVVAAVKIWTAAQTLLNAVLTANPIGLIVVAIAALVAGLVWAYNNVDWFRDMVDGAWAWIQETFTRVVRDIGVILDDLAAFFVDLWNRAQPIFEFLKSSFENLIAFGRGVLDFFIGIFTGDWQRVWDGVKGIFAAVWEQIKLVASTAWEFISSVFLNAYNATIAPVVSWIGDRLRDLGAWFGELWTRVSDVWTWIVDKLNTAWAWIRDNVFAPLGTGIENVKGFFDGLWTKVQEVWSWIQEKISAVWSWINQNVFAPMNLGIMTIGSFFTGLWTTVQTVWNNITTFFTGIAEGISATVTDVKEGIANITAEIKSFLGLDFSAGVKGTNALGQTVVSDGNPLTLDVAFPGRAEGGPVSGPGGPRDDRVLTALSPGEYVVNAAATARHLGLIRAINADTGDASGGFAVGGLVGAAADQVRNSLANFIGPLLQAKKDAETAPAVGGFAGNGNWGPVNMGGLAENTAAAKAFIIKQWGITNIGGWRASGSVAGSDHPYGKALDVMIANYLSAAGIAQGTSVAEWFIKNPNAFGTKYVIWRDRINENGAWSPYRHSSGSMNDTMAHRDHVHLSFLTGPGGFGGSPVGDGPEAAAGPGGDPVERWRTLALAALASTGQSPTHIGRMLNQIRTESSGNPTAQNNTDINARRGTPSRGLLQVIQPTFEAALRGTRYEGLIARGPTDPWANMISSILYAVKRYGSLDRAYRGVAYDQGGLWQTGTAGFNASGRVEAVLTGEEREAYQLHARSLVGGGARSIVIEAGAVQINVNGSGGDPEAIRVALDAALRDILQDQLDRSF